MKRTEYYQQIRLDYHASGAKKVSPNRLNRSFIAGFFWILFAALLSLVQGASASTVSGSSGAESSNARISGLIEQLRSDDAATRQSAATAITSIGEPARPVILQLLRSQDPGLRQQAAQILLSLPWYLPNDPPQVKKLLVGYGSPEIELRREIVGALAELENGAGLDALSRLMGEEPSPAVQWSIVSCLRQVGNLDGFRTLQAPADNSRMLALCGYAKLSVDLPAAMDDLRQCAELECTDPADDDGEFDFVIRALADAACQQKRYEEAANWRRRELARGSVSDAEGVPIALVELFALQGEFGPIKGLDGDIHRAGDDIQRPKLQYSLARLYRQMGNSAKADAAQQTAFAGSASRMQRYDVGDFLCDHGWNDLAETELKAYLQMDAPDGGVELRQADANVHLRLAGIAIERDDDQTAAHEKEQAMLLLPKDETLTKEDAAGHRWTVGSQAIWAEIYWRYLRAAVAKHNEPEINRRLEQLLQLKPTDADIAIEVVPLLRHRGRTVDANLMFQWAYDDLKKDLDADPADPEKLNGLAWLCAKCDRDLPDAKVWADKAAQIAPENAAILDTQAEVNFHLGRADEAVRLETAASALQPDDPFMKTQLARFKAAATNGPATRPR
jgi:tetratricopeptide (TPR) repeat protein